jgi:hypothetical protein
MTTKWGETRQRDDLKTCPFCGTKAIQQGRLADNSTEQQWRVLCGNPFCTLDCATHVFAAITDAESAWECRVGEQEENTHQ